MQAWVDVTMGFGPWTPLTPPPSIQPFVLGFSLEREAVPIKGDEFVRGVRGLTVLKLGWWLAITVIHIALDAVLQSSSWVGRLGGREQGDGWPGQARDRERSDQPVATRPAPESS